MLKIEQKVLDSLEKVLQQPVQNLVVEGQQQALALLHEILLGIASLAQLQLDLLEALVGWFRIIDAADLLIVSNSLRYTV